MHQSVAANTIQCRDDASTGGNPTLVMEEVKFRSVAVLVLLDVAVAVSMRSLRWQGRVLNANCVPCYTAGF
jgi:hypothetical protein